MDMYKKGCDYMEKQLIICASPYQQKYYFESNFEDMPQAIKEELIAEAAKIAEKINGIVSIGFNEQGNLFIEQTSEDNVFVDEIGAALEIKKFQSEKQELIKALKMWYMVYRTEYGKIVREIVLMQASKLSNQEIIQKLEIKYGEQARDFVMNLLAE